MGDRMKRLDQEIVSQLSNMVHIIAKTTMVSNMSDSLRPILPPLPSPPLASVLYSSCSGGYSCVNTIIKKRVQV